MAYVQAGGGLVADSVPANEYMETIHKAAAVQRAIDLAEAGLIATRQAGYRLWLRRRQCRSARHGSRLAAE